MSTLDSMLALLVSEDPRRSADRILMRLVQICQARAGAILRLRDQQVDIWLSSGLTLSSLAELPVRWADHKAALAAGRPVVEPAFAMLPCVAEDGIVAVLYLAQPQVDAIADARVFGAAIAQAVQAADEHAPAPRLPDVSPAQEAKLQLLALLERNDWNLAKVARIMGVTRRTVYLRLQAFGIERRRVPKLYKKLPNEA